MDFLRRFKVGLTMTSGRIEIFEEEEQKPDSHPGS